ncbi:MAG: metallophosphoesterase [Oscillospiraceae bacterium]|nr:metallophosphoesterase [Oscillospiraceae bacterium]
MIRLLHAADFHLDSAFGALSPENAKLRRREGRDTIRRLSNYVNQNAVDIVLLAGDLFDGALVYRETLEAMGAALGAMNAQVFIAPGNHDPYTPHSPYVTEAWPDNVHIFSSSRIESVALPELGCVVYGAAFTSAEQSESLLRGFRAPEDGRTHLMVLHADLDAASAQYDPITRGEVHESGLTYLALGHVHRVSGVERVGKTAVAYCGCIEGRGFDELGERGFLCGTAAPSDVQMEFVPFALRRYEVCTAALDGGVSAEEAIRTVTARTTADDIYRIILTGETREEISLARLHAALAGEFFHLELRDETRVARDVWARQDEDSLRGLFLRGLRAQYDAATEEAQRRRIEQAVRFGLAALDGREL